MVAFRFLLVLFLCLGGLSARPQAAQTETFDIELPLDHGRLNVRDVLTELCDELGLQPPEAIAKLDWSLDVQSLLGRMQLRVFDRLTDGAVESSVRGDRVVMEVDREALKSKLAEAGRSLESWISDLTGRVRQQQARNFGLTVVTAGDPAAPLAAQQPAPERMVVLVHGLDDPGFMWRDLIPALRSAGHHVARFEYPNDGPVSESADLLAAALGDLRKAGVECVDVVAHSMGGLVTRDVLTRPAYYAGDGAAGERDGEAAKFPSIDHLIMLGTPNHGSKWARLRMVAELREHFYRALHGEEQWLSGFDADGTGEAGIDLLPNSDFLRRLNDRPLASHTQYTIIAGQCGSELAEDVKSFAQRVRKLAEATDAPAWLRELASTENEELAASFVGDTVNELGDGCVTVESARLQGVDDFVIVPGNHLSMIVNIGADKTSGRVPPAIPLVLERLSRP